MRHRLEFAEARLARAVVYIPEEDMSAYVMETEAITKQQAEGCEQCQEVPTRRRDPAPHMVTTKATGLGGYSWECTCGAMGQPTPPEDTYGNAIFAGHSHVMAAGGR